MKSGILKLLLFVFMCVSVASCTKDEKIINNKGVIDSNNSNNDKNIDNKEEEHKSSENNIKPMNFKVSSVSGRLYLNGKVLV